jgi:type I restriction enzyme M protein
VTGIEAHNTSRRKLRAILADPGRVAGNLRAPIAAFDADTRDVIEKFDFDAQIGCLDRAKLPYLVFSKVTEVDLHPTGSATSRWDTSSWQGERRTWPAAE